ARWSTTPPNEWPRQRQAQMKSARLDANEWPRQRQAQMKSARLDAGGPRHRRERRPDPEDTPRELLLRELLLRASPPRSAVPPASRDVLPCDLLPRVPLARGSIRSAPGLWPLSRACCREPSRPAP